MKKNLIILFLVIGTFALAQKKSEITISGIAYMTGSRSQGIVNGKVFTDPQIRFKNQNIYFNNDTLSIKATTDSLGAYTVQLKPGSYNVYQEAAINDTHKGGTSYGSAYVVAKKDGGPYDLYFKNTVNGRSAINKGMPNSGTKKSETKKTEVYGPTQK